MKIIRIKEVQSKTSLSKTLIHYKVREGSPYYDASFPKPVPLGARMVGWVEAEVDDWIAARVSASRTGQTVSQVTA
ncbi:helix-turn-helix transcriptional regulator [Paraburkholderia solisilvae]|uniref:Prophage CP4-57 regulatory protein (AlpA) n=1 Tax=Paraburkholderia solisilvae TaxID=624376 RepID=A0A6J5DHZ9_9BURK|nr:AlpA family phage regulatory protein [Paraburkholderia solisilvae]CAB3753077.1 hypothetical protein LMG29739_01661 [Paraburkholderia solisilvae]